MLNSVEEVIAHINEQYKDVEYLSNDSQGHPKYSHDYNGVGCSIGCCLPEDLCRFLDDFDDSSITSLLKDSDVQNQIRQHIGGNVFLEQLVQIQGAHDYSNYVDEFLNEINSPEFLDLMKSITDPTKLAEKSLWI